MASISGVSSFGGYTLSVTPELLLDKSTSVLTAIRDTNQLFEEVTRIAKNTVQYWKGEAGDIHRELFASIVPVMEEIFNRYTEHGNDLNSIAVTYSGAESAAENIIESLPDNPL